MKSHRRELLLGAYLSYGVGHHAGAWRHPNAIADGALSIDHYRHLAELAERGLFDFMFLSDTPSVFTDDRAGYGGRVVVLEPLTLLSALATSTSNLGLIATASTTYKEPYNLAREFASLDLISNGRAGWNMVTSSKTVAAYNFGAADHPAHDARYDRAIEFYDVVTGLWDSWDADALPRNKATGIFYDPAKVHALDHNGTHFSVRGPLNISRSRQGRPIVVQAGSSEPGRELAARTAEIVFTAQADLEAAKAFYADVKGRLERFGRAPEDLRILPGVSVYSADSRGEAEDKLAELQGLVHPQLGLSMLSDLLGGVNLEGHDVDGPLPPLPQSNGNQSRQALIKKLSLDEGLSIRALYERLTVARGHLVLVGSHKDVADALVAWFEAEACDGFNVMPPCLPGDLASFVEGVVPLLQRTGLYKRAYRPGTLREKLGVSFPVSRHAAAPTNVVKQEAKNA